MSKIKRTCLLSLILMVFFLTPPVRAEQAKSSALYVAVAANFAPVFEQISAEFKTQHGIELVPSYASTGKLYAQIINGAPFALFLSADTATPQKLEKDAYTVPDKRFTYAVGHLVLWSAQPRQVDAKGEVLASDSFDRLAIANPTTAPYGLAAQQVLMRLGQWQRLQPKLIQAESIAQVHQFVSSGNVPMGFIAASQVPAHSGSFWRVPAELHDPIEQQVVILKSAQHNADAFKLYDFLRSEKAARIISAFGYSVPDMPGAEPAKHTDKHTSAPTQ